MKRTTLLLRLLALTAMPARALAQSEERPGEVYADETILEEDAFRDLRIEGEMVGPDGTVTFERRIATFSPMVRLRTDFSQEMVESLDQIR